MSASMFSLLPEDFAVGTLPVGDMEVVDARFEVYDYEGKVTLDDGAAYPTCLRLDVKVLSDGTEHTEWVSAGSSANVVPTKDGLSMEGNNEKANSIYANTKLALFIVSLVGKGFPKSLLKPFSSASLVGLQFTAERPLAPESDMQSNAHRTDGKSRKDRPKTFFAVKEIIKLPSDAKKASKATGSTKSTGKPPAGATAASKATMGVKVTPADDGVDTNEQAMSLVLDILSKSDSGVPIPGLKVKGFSALRSEEKEVREEILKLITDAEWLGEHGFTVTDGVVTS